MNKIKFLEEAPGVQSFQRLQSLLLTILFILAVSYHVYKNGLDFELTIILAAVAVLPKSFQKVIEMKYGKDTINEEISKTDVQK
jgi:hypothetical protein